MIGRVAISFSLLRGVGHSGKSRSGISPVMLPTRFRGYPLNMMFAFILVLGSIQAVFESPDDSPAVNDLRTRIAAIRKRADLPALGVAALADGRIVQLETVGVRANGRDAATDRSDHWHLGSCGKAMTATVLARLVEAGSLSWASTIGSVFGDVDEIHPNWHPVTLAQLVRHRSGLPEDRTPDSVIFPKVRRMNGPLPLQRLEVVRLVLARPPASQRGKVMAYSNFGYAVASAMAERVTGRPWEALCREWLSEPLEMTSAGFGPPGAGDGDGIDHPHGHLGDRPVPPSILADNPAAIAAAGTIHANLKDWSRFLGLHLGLVDGFLSPATIEELHRPALNGRYAAGWMTGTRRWAGVDGLKPGPILTHSGSNGLWYAVTWLAPERGWALMAVTNKGGPDAARACDEAIGVLIKSIDGAIPDSSGNRSGDQGDAEASP